MFAPNDAQFVHFVGRLCIIVTLCYLLKIFFVIYVVAVSTILDCRLFCFSANNACGYSVFS